MAGPGTELDFWRMQINISDSLKRPVLLETSKHASGACTVNVLFRSITSKEKGLEDIRRICCESVNSIHSLQRDFLFKYDLMCFNLEHHLLVVKGDIVHM